jgi:hypothetical protein
MRPLNRPMFRYGGPIKEGIMHGMKDGGSLSPQFNTGLVGDERYPKAGGREKHAVFLAPLAMQGLAAAGRFLAPRAIAAGAKAFGRGLATSPGKTGVFDKGLTIGQRLRNILPTGRFLQPATPKGQVIPGKYTPAPLRISEAIRSPEAIGRAIRENPVAAFIGAGQIKNTPEILGGAYDIGKGTLQAGANYLLGTEFGKKKASEAGEGEVKVVDQIGAGEGTTGGSVTDDPNKAKQIQEDRIAKTKKRYYELMGLDKMKKDAAYDSLIDASKIVTEEGADLKGAIKSGTLQNRIIQAISKNLDKSADIKRQIDAAILKGEITKDIASADTTDKRLKEARIKALDRAEKQAGASGQIAAVVAKDGVISGSQTAAILRADGIKYDGVLQDKLFNNFKKDNPTADEIDFMIAKGAGLDDGRYVIGARLVEKKGPNVAFIV